MIKVMDKIDELYEVVQNMYKCVETKDNTKLKQLCRKVEEIASDENMTILKGK